MPEKKEKFYENVIKTYNNVENVLERFFTVGRVQCNNIAVVNWKRDLETRYLQIKDGDYSVSLGEEAIIRRPGGWRFITLRNVKVVERISRIMESGILEKWETFRTFAINLKNITRLRRNFVPLTLNGNILTLFIICGLLIAVASGFFCIEVRKVIKIVFVAVVTCKFRCQCQCTGLEMMEIMSLGQ